MPHSQVVLASIIPQVKQITVVVTHTHLQKTTILHHHIVILHQRITTVILVTHIHHLKIITQALLIIINTQVVLTDTQQDISHSQVDTQLAIQCLTHTEELDTLEAAMEDQWEVDTAVIIHSHS